MIHAIRKVCWQFCLERRTASCPHSTPRGSIFSSTSNMHAACSAWVIPGAAAAPRAPRRSVRATRSVNNRGIVWAAFRAQPLHQHIKMPAAPLRASETEGPSASEISVAMQAARDCEAGGMSPGAGLASSEAQAEAAFADMINTTVDVTGESLGAEELETLARGGMMDKASTSKKSGSLLDDVKDLFGALSKGAHIVKQKGGRV
jgi:hypothetical protein